MSTLPDVKAYDAVVVGLGPAGATVAYQLSRAGLSVLGLDKATHPRYKVCGGGLSARIDRIFVADNPGHWMLHCHVTDHQESGMMAVIRVS
jgi:flavin-dependent dehydrogenase